MDGMKTCFKCKSVKPMIEFYRHRFTADGHLGKCKDCTKSDVKAHRDANVEAVRAYDRERASLPHRAELRSRVCAANRKRHPDRGRARSKAFRAYPSAPESCERCGGSSSRIERHHIDYAKPLLVEWLCKPCHYIADSERRQKERAA